MTEAAFLSDLILRVAPPREWGALGGRKWEVYAALVFWSRRFNGSFVVPAGKRTDLASIPRGLWSIYPPDGPWIRGAVVHDCGYEKGLLTINGEPVHLIKPYVDELLGEAMRADGVPQHRCDLFVNFVRAFGTAAALRGARENVATVAEMHAWAAAHLVE